MSIDPVQVRYDQLTTISVQFSQQVETIQKLYTQLQRSYEPLAQGDWQGKGWGSFSTEMTTRVFPSIQRLQTALTTAQTITNEVVQIFQNAEEEAAALFKGGMDAGIAEGGIAGSAGTVASAVKSIPSTFADMQPTSEQKPGTITMEQADQIFKDMQDEPDIPFYFLNDGCAARADMMAKLMQERQASYNLAGPLEIDKAIIETQNARSWIKDVDGQRIRNTTPPATPNDYLYFPTKNIDWGFPSTVKKFTSIDGQEVNELSVYWDWHIAPVVYVQDANHPEPVPMVIDPSVADRPLSPEEWKGKMHNSKAEISLRDENWYDPWTYVDHDKTDGFGIPDSDPFKDRAVNSRTLKPNVIDNDSAGNLTDKAKYQYLPISNRNKNQA